MALLNFRRFTFFRDKNLLIGDYNDFFPDELQENLKEGGQGFQIVLPSSRESIAFRYVHDFYEDDKNAGMFFKAVDTPLELSVKIYR